MAEWFLEHLAGDLFKAYSTGVAPTPQIGCCSTINLARQHEMNQDPGAIPPWNRAFGTRSRLTG
jgi:hypothetical protein